MTLLDGGALAGDWTLDPAQSTVKLATKSMWNLAKVTGRFTGISGAGTITPDGRASGTVTIAAATIDTANPRRDKHLRSKDFFDAEKHPEITYSASAVAVAGSTATIEGTLTVLGNSRPLTVPAAVSAAGDTVTLDATAKVNRKDFGMGFNMLSMMSSDNTLTVHAVFTRA